MKEKYIFPKVVIISCLLAVISFFLFSYEIKQFEAGTLDVVATAQDGYVQLVIDQINLKENRNDEDIVNNILSTLDSSSNKYWTFSKEDTIIFVKDVLETNKFKNFTASTYYSSDSAKEFYGNLQKNKVTHQVIEMNGNHYIASGTIFNYQDSNYRLLLLSNKDVIFENNDYLKGKTELYIVYYCSLLLLLIMGCILAWKNDNQRRKIAELNTEITSLNEKLVKLNNIVMGENTEQRKVWDLSDISAFVTAFKKKNINKGMTTEVTFNNRQSKNQFIRNQLSLLSSDLICFDKSENSLLLLSVYETEDELNAFLQIDGIQSVQYKAWSFK